MSQTFEDFPSSEKIRDSRPKIANRDEALRSAFSGATAPALPTPVDGQFWYKSDDHTPNQRRNGAWVDMESSASRIGTQTRKLAHRAHDRPHLFDWISSGQHLTILKGTNSNAFGAEVNAALAALVADGYLGGTLLSAGVINLDESIVFPQLIGIGIEGAGLVNNLAESATRFVAVHSAGPAFHLTKASQFLRGFVIDADTARNTGAAGSNYGVLIEPPDDESSHCNGCVVEYVGIRSQPNVGLLQSANCNHARYDNVRTRANKSHAFQLDDGTLRGRTNISRPGQNKLIDCRAFEDLGHALVAGNADTSGFYRLELYNFEADAGHDAAKLITANQVWIHGENATIIGCAFSGERGSGAAFGALSISGRCHRVINNRYVSTTQPINVRRNDSTSGRETRDIVIDGILLSQDSTANPAVAVDTTTDNCQEITVIAPNNDVITSWMTAGVKGGRIIGNTFVEDYSRQHRSLDYTTKRDGAVTGYHIERTGSGAATGDLQASGGNIEVGSSSDVDTVLKRNNVEIARLSATSLKLNQKKLNFGAATSLTIASGAITITGSRHYVDTEAAAATDDLETINGGENGDILIISCVASGRTVVVKDAVGNIQLSADRNLNHIQDQLLLINRDGTNWIELATFVSPA